MSFQELDEQDFPVTRVQLEIDRAIAEKEREGAAEVDAAERMRERPTFRRVDPAKETQALDIEDFPAERSDAPPPKVLRDIGAVVGKAETAIGSVSVRLREQSATLREDPRETIQVARGGKPKTVKRGFRAKKVDTAEDLQTLDEQPFPVSRPVGMETPQPIRIVSGLTLRAGAGFYDALTLPARPTLIGETVKTGVGVVISHKVRKQVATAIKKDPAGFGAELVGGILGGRALGKIAKGVGTRIERIRYGETFTEIPDEAFFHSAEEGLRYPQPVDTTRIEVVAKTESPIQFETGKPFNPSDFRIKKGMAGGLRAETIGQVEPKIRFITHLRGGVEHLPGIRIQDIAPSISGPSTLVRATTILGGISSLRPEKLATIATPKTKTAPDVFTGPGLVSPTKIGETPITEPITDPIHIRPEVIFDPGVILVIEPVIIQAPDVTPILTPRTHTRARTVITPILAPVQISRQRQRIAPPFTFPPIQKITTTKTDRFRIPLEKKKKRAPTGRRSLFAGEFRAYNLKDILDLI